MKDIEKKIATERRAPAYTGANWNNLDDEFTQHFYEQNLSQFWRPEDISMQPDLNLWHVLPEEVQDAYVKNLVVLTLLDTYQGDIGMPVVSRSMNEEDHQRKAVLNFMGAMENAVHAKSYSNIFMTYLTTPEIDKYFEWGHANTEMQEIMEDIVMYYKKLDRMNYIRQYEPERQDFDDEAFKIAQWQAMVASVFLESCLFYSGFFYPLWFYGQGKLMMAGEIINLILRDESIHGVYVGLLAQETFNSLRPEVQEALQEWIMDFFEPLYKREMKLTEDIYNQVSLTHEVKKFVRYNANKAFMNLGFEPYFEEEEIDPVVLNGLNTETKMHDFFSGKGNGYQKAVSEELTDDDFDDLFDF